MLLQGQKVLHRLTHLSPLSLLRWGPLFSVPNPACILLMSSISCHDRVCRSHKFTYCEKNTVLPNLPTPIRNLKDLLEGDHPSHCACPAWSTGRLNGSVRRAPLQNPAKLLASTLAFAQFQNGLAHEFRVLKAAPIRSWQLAAAVF